MGKLNAGVNIRYLAVDKDENQNWFDKWFPSEADMVDWYWRYQYCIVELEVLDANGEAVVARMAALSQQGVR